MKFNIRKETALKGLLFMALAGNVSFFNPTVQSATLASRSETVGAHDSAPGPKAQSQDVQLNRPGAVRTQLEAKAAVKLEEPPKAPKSRDGEDAKEASESRTRTELPTVCNQRFYVTYREVPAGDDVTTEVHVKLHNDLSGDFKESTFRLQGDFATNIDNKEIKAENDRKLTNSIRKKMGAMCIDESVVAPKEDRQPEAKTAGRRHVRPGRDGREQANCAHDGRGETLSESARMECLIEQVMSISTPDDDSDNGSATSQKRRMMSKLERLVQGDIRKSIKNRLLSKDESSVQEGQDMIDELSQKLQDLAVDNDLDTSRTTRLISGLSALKTGGDTYRQTMRMADEVREEKKDTSDEMAEAQRMIKENPNDPVARMNMIKAQQDVISRQQNLQAQAQQQIQMGSMAQLEAIRNQGMMTLTEYNQFTQPYKVMMGDIQSMSMGIQGAPGVGGMNQNMFGPQMTLANGMQVLQPNSLVPNSGNINFMQQQQQGISLLNPTMANQQNAPFGSLQMNRPGMFVSPVPSSYVVPTMSYRPY